MAAEDSPEIERTFRLQSTSGVVKRPQLSLPPPLATKIGWTDAARMALTATTTQTLGPSMTATISCRLGLKVRRVMPVGLRPKPPLATAWPRQAGFMPLLICLPVKSHCLAMGDTPKRTRGRKGTGWGWDARRDPGGKPGRVDVGGQGMGLLGPLGPLRNEGTSGWICRPSASGFLG